MMFVQGVTRDRVKEVVFFVSRRLFWSIASILFVVALIALFVEFCQVGLEVEFFFGCFGAFKRKGKQ
jgi:hypothetical protein